MSTRLAIGAVAALAGLSAVFRRGGSRSESVGLRVLDVAVRNLFERGTGKFSKRLYCDHGGPCGVVADAIHEVVGGKKLGVCAKQWEIEEGPQHIVVRVAPGKVVDAWGVVSDQQMLETWGRHTVSRAGLPPDTWEEEGWYFCDLSRSGIDMPNDIGRNPALSAEMADALRKEIFRLGGCVPPAPRQGEVFLGTVLPCTRQDFEDSGSPLKATASGTDLSQQVPWVRR